MEMNSSAIPSWASVEHSNLKNAERKHSYRRNRLIVQPMPHSDKSSYMRQVEAKSRTDRVIEVRTNGHTSL